MNKTGRPKKTEHKGINNREELLNAAIRIITNKGVKHLTVRTVSEEAGVSTGTFYHFFADKNSLLMQFIREPSFDNITLTTPLSDISGRIAELYMIMINRYIKLGKGFVKSFYSPANEFLTAYMSGKYSRFLPGTVMERSEKELNDALKAGLLKISPDDNVHTIAADICSIVKGCMFEWCLNDEIVDAGVLTERIIRNYLFRYV